MRMIDAMKVLSHDTRLRLMSVLRQHELCVCELEDILGERQANISKHLTKLKEVGLVDVRKEKQRAFYVLTKTALDHELLNQVLVQARKEDPTLQKDYEQFMKHEQTKDQKIFVCNIMKKEVLA